MAWVLGLISLSVLRVWTYTADIEYQFTNNYQTQVTPTSGTCYASKQSSGSSDTVVTPYGLYLSGTEVKLSSNEFSTCPLPAATVKYAFTVFVRYLPGIAGTAPREILTLRNGSDVRFQITQASQAETDSPNWELKYIESGVPSVIASTQSYALSKPYTGKWYFFMFKVTPVDGNSLLSFCINGIQTGLGTPSTTNDWNDNYLNGPMTRAIYYRLNYKYNTNFVCNTMTGYSLTLSGSPCSYVCPSSSLKLCEADTYSYDFDCDDCGGACGSYGCEQDAPLKCYSADCTPLLTGSTTTKDQRCKTCYSHSYFNTTTTSCACDTKYFKRADHGLACIGKCQVDCNGASVTEVGALSQCSTCYDFAKNSGPNCVCSVKTKYNPNDTTFKCLSKG
jgi:hypothetical protein